MKSSVEGGYLAGCCSGLEVWGIHCNAPQFLALDDHSPIAGGFDFTYDWQGTRPGTYTGQSLTEEFRPELWAHATQTWGMSAAKVPSSYPAGCNKPGLTSSAADASWEVPIATVGEHTDFGGPEWDFQLINGYRFCHSSRAIYVNGRQAYVGYRMTGFPADGDLPGAQGTSHAHFAHHIGDHAIVDIAAQSLVGFYYVERPAHAGTTIQSETELEENLCGGQYFSNASDPDNVVPTALDAGNDGSMPPCNTYCLGKDYCTFSTYTPDSIAQWTVGRIKYEGTRLGVDGVEAFVSQHDVGHVSTTYHDDAEYFVVLPSVRTYIDSSVEGIDECWVLAMAIDGGETVKLITAKWQSKVYRPGVGSEDEETGLADGTLSPAEVAASNVILDTADVPAEFESELWEDLRVRCYNRVYDPSTGHSVDLVLFTTQGDAEDATAEPLADFEGDINSGLPEGIEFNNGTVEVGWEIDNTEAHAGTYSAASHGNDVEGPQEMSLIIDVVENDSDLSFWWWHDNRKLPTNIAEVDEYFAFYIDGVEVLRVDHADDFDPEDYEVWTQFQLSVDAPAHLLSAGRHKLVWRHFRASTAVGYPFMVTYIDDVQLPEILVVDDFNGVNRWFSARGRIYRARYWAWPRRDDEVSPPTDFTGRVSTVPDFITMDKQGRIMYGNPHYVCRILLDPDTGDDTIDETFGGPPHEQSDGRGYLRFTASPAIAPPEPPCYDPEVTGEYTVDAINDPSWGAMQILPTSHGFQLRGMNANLRDATVDPLMLDSYTFSNPQNDGRLEQEEFRKILHPISGGSWSMRASCWTISEDGSERVPHLEIVWRPTYHQPAWPGPESEWTHPPYRSDFATATGGDIEHLGAGAVRPREIFALPDGSLKPRWSPTNYVVARSYCDALSQSPQHLWHRYIDDPPSDDEDPEWWDPDWDLAYAQGLGHVGGPWKSAQWSPAQARFDPCAWRGIRYSHESPAPEVVCPDAEENPVEAEVWRIETLSNQFPITDFDVIDCVCACGCR